MSAARPTDPHQQAAHWNGTAGHAWVEMQGPLDRMFAPFEAMLVEAVAASGARHVMDIGCGTGGVALAAARALGRGGHVTGIDISEPMLALARSRAEQEGAAATFVCADAQSHAFAPASFDLLISRFGVMFFDDPVQAFANLWRASRNDARLRLIAWRSAAENPFMTTAERAAAPLLPDLPPRRPGPGQFAFADAAHVRSMLEEAGWAEIDIQPLDVGCSLPEAELGRYLTLLGPVGQALREADAATHARVIEAIRPSFDRFVVGREVRFTAACWTIGGRASALQRR